MSDRIKLVMKATGGHAHVILSREEAEAVAELLRRAAASQA